MDDKLKKLYSLYKSSGLIKTTDFNTFSKANSAQRKKIYDLGRSSGLIKSIDFNTFNTAFEAVPIKKKSSTSQKKESTSQDGSWYLKTLKEAGLPVTGKQKTQKASVSSGSIAQEQAKIKQSLTASFKPEEQAFAETQRKLKSYINRLEVEKELSDTEMAAILNWSEADVKRAKEGVPSKNIAAKPANVDPKSIDRYNDMLSSKVGITSNQLKAVNDIESKKATDLKSRVKYYNNVDTQERLKERGYDIDVNGDINDEKTKSALAKESVKWKIVKYEQDKKNDIFDKIDDNIDLNLISNTEEYVVDELRKKFSGSGFVFEESGMGNYLTVKFTPDGSTKTKEIEIPLGGRGSLSIAKEGNYSDGLSEDNAKKLRDFMKGAYMTNTEWKKFSPTEEEFKNGRADALNHLTWMLKSTNLMAKNPAKYGKELIGDDQFENVLERASFAIKDEYEWLKGDYDNLKKQIDAYNRNPTDAERVAINNRMHELAVKEYKLNEKANKISEVDKNWNKITGAYALEQSKKGSVIGNWASSFLSGFSSKSIEKTILGVSMDVGVNLMDAKNLTDASTYQRYKDEGMSDDNIKEKVLAKAKRFIMPRLDEAYTTISTLGTTTEEYKKSPERGIFENVISGLAESVGVKMSGTGALGFFAMAYDSMQTQMLGKEFDGLTQSEKMLISVPFGLTVGALEEFGYDASVGFSKSGLFNKIINKIIRKSITDLPKDATVGEIKREINKNVATLVKSGAIKIAAGSITEGNVEGIQGFTEIGTKNLVNELYDKELFKNVPDLSTKDGLIEAVGMASEDAALGALGGLIMGGGAISTTTYKQAKFNETSDYNFDVFYGSLMDDNLRKSIKYNTKIKLKNGEITESEAKEELESIDRNTGILRSIPADLSLRDKKDSFNLIIERNKLEQEIDGKDAALIVKQKARISEINSELNKISENATKENNIQQQEGTTEGSTSEYPGANQGQPEVGQTEGSQRQTTQPEANLGDSTVAGRSVQELGEDATQEVNTYIAELGANERIGGTLDSVMAKMNNAEYINDSEINSTIDTIFNEVESINNDANYSDQTKKALSDKLMNIAEQLDNYEFRTKTETVAVTQRGTAATTEQAPTTKVSAEKFFEGQTAEVNGMPATFKSNKGRTEAVMENGETVVLDTPTMIINEGDFEFDDAGALTAVTVTDRFGTTAKFTGDIAMDLAIKQRENQIGTVEQAEFETVYKEVETKYVKETPNKKEASNDEKVKTLRAEEQAELANAIPNIEEYRVNGEINKESMPADVRAKYDEIYAKYDNQIAPLLEVPVITQQPATQTTELEAKEQELGDKLKAKYSELESQGMTLEEMRNNTEYKAIRDEWYKAYLALQEQTGETKTEKATAEQEVVAEAKTLEQEVEELGQLISGSDVEIDNAVKAITDKRMAKIVAKAKKALSRIAPGVKFKVYNTDAEYRKAIGDDPNEDPSGGAFDRDTNTIHINLTVANYRTVAHEVFHSVLWNKIRSNKNVADVTKKMIETISSKLEGMPELKKYLDDFASNYDENIQNEEKLSELVGVLADNYMNTPASIKDIIARWIDRLAKIFGLDPYNRNEVYDMLKTIARKTAKGKVIKQSDVKIIESVDNGTSFESEYVSTNGTVVNTPSIRKSKFVNTVVKKSDIIDINDLEGKPLEIVYYDNFTSSPYELKNRVSGSTVKRKGEGGPGYSYRDEIRKKNIIAAFTTVTKGLNLIQGVRSRNEIAGEPAVVGVALQNKETGHLGNKTTARDFYSPVDGQIAQAVNDGLLSEQEAVKMLKGAVVAYESTKKGQDSKSSLGFTSNDFNSLNEFFDKIYNISFERRGTFNAIAIPSKASLKITSATKPYVITWLNSGIPTLNEYYEETTEEYTKEAEAHDIVKYLDPKLDVIGVDSSVNVSEKEIERAKEMGVEIVTIDDSLTHTSYPVVLFGKNIGIPSTFNSVRDMAQEWNVPNPFFKAGRRSDKSEPVRIPKTEATSKKPNILKQKPVAGNKLFNEPLKDATTIAERYAKKSGIKMQEVIPVTSLDKENSKAISDEFEKMKDDPTNPEVAKSYNAMAEETIAQYKEIVKDGYFVEINNEEPYSSSEDMIKDLKENKRFKVFSTESGFGDDGITEKQRAENPLLKDSGFKDVNGETLLVNDVFRFVHDFFGHAKFGNSFGPIGEENAWMIHSVMYSPLARRAMTSETRGQNSYVNFSGINEEAFRLRDKARALRQEGKIEQANKLVEKVYEIMKFADQKVGLMPEWVSGTGSIDGAVKVRKQKPSGISAIIKLAKENTFSDAAIRQYLLNKGFSEEQIDNAMAPYMAKENAKNDFNIEYSRLIDEGATEENAFNEAMYNVVYSLDDDMLIQEVSRELMNSYGKKTTTSAKKPKTFTIIADDAKGLAAIIKIEAKAIREKKKETKEVLASIAAQVKDMVTKGKISVRQMSAIINALKNTNLDNRVMVDRYVDYVSRVISRADFIERVNKGMNFKKAIKRNLKNKANPFVAVAKSFTELNPKWVVDIDRYNEIAELVFNSVKPTRISKGEVSFKSEADINLIGKYIAEEQANHLKIKEENLRALYEKATGEKSEGKSVSDMLNELRGDKVKTDYTDKIKKALKEKIKQYKELVTENDPKEVKQAVNVDIDLIDAKLAIGILDALDTYFANDSNASLKALMATYKGIVMAKNFKLVAKPLRLIGSKKVGRAQSQEFTNINIVLKRMFRGQNAALSFMEAIGFNDMIQGSNRAERQAIDKQNEYSTMFKKVKNFNSAENIFERNVIAFIARRDINANAEESINKRIKLLKDSVDVLRKSGTSIEIAKADLYEKVLKKLGLYEEGATLESARNKAESYNLSAVDFVTNMFSEIYDSLSDTALGVYNTMLENDINYTPDKYSTLDAKIGKDEFDLDSSGFMMFNSNFKVDENKASVLMSTNRPERLPKNMYVDLDFDSNMFRSYRLALNDMYTAEAIRQANAFINSDEFENIIPTAEDRAIVESAIKSYVITKKGKNYIEKSSMSFMNSLLDTIGGFGAVRALGGFSQFLNQFSTAQMNTFINAGEYMRPLDLFDKDLAKMIANSGLPISNLGVEAVTTIENADKELEKVKIAAGAMSAIDKYGLSYIKKYNEKLLKFVLSNPDRYARIQAFAAYYRKSMKAQGLKADFSAPMNEKAARYAQSMIDANMDVSDTAMRGKFFTDKEPYKKIIKQIFFPFSTFSLNQRNRVWSDVAVVANPLASNEDKATAVRSFVAFSAEFAAYNSIRYGVGLLLIHAACLAMGLDDEEEKAIVDKYTENLLKSIKSSAVTDILSPSPVFDEATLNAMNKLMLATGIGSASEEDFQKYISEVNDKRAFQGKEPLTEDEVKDKKDKFFEDEQFQFYVDNEKSTGMLGIQLTKMSELYDILKARSTGYYTRKKYAGGGEEEVKLSDEAKEKLDYIALLKLVGATVGTREVDQVADKMFKIAKEKYTFTEKQNEKYEAVKKKYKVDPYKMSLIKSSMKEETMLEEIEYIESTGGLTPTQSKEYAKLREYGAIDGWGLDDIRNGKTTEEIIASRK